MKLIKTALIATSLIGVASSASAWGYNRCDAVAPLQVYNNFHFAKKCRGHIIDVGIISAGDHKGTAWKDAYPDVNFKKYDDPYIELGGFKNRPLFMKSVNGWTVDDNIAPRTKRIHDNDLFSYLDRFGLTRDENNNVKKAK